MGRFAIGLVVLLAACTDTLGDEALSVCLPLCRCADAPLPGEQRDCTSACVTAFENNPPAQACSACVIAHADRCTSLIDDCTLACRRVVGRSFLEDAIASGIEVDR